MPAALLSLAHDPARGVVAVAADGREAACPLSPGTDPAAVERLAPGFLTNPLSAGSRAGALAAWAALPAADRGAHGAILAALHALRGETLGGPAAPPRALATEAPVDADPIAACRDPARTLVVADATTGGPDGLLELAALARAMDVTLALRPLDGSPAELARATALAAALSLPVATASPLPAPPSIAGGGPLTVTEVRLHRIALPLETIYVSSMYVIDRQARTLVELRTQGGAVGWGETHAPASAIAARLAEGWLGRDIRARRALRRRFGRVVFDNREGRNGLAGFAGLELAGWDAEARAAGLPLRALLGHTGEARPIQAACPLPAAVPGETVDRAALAAHMADLGNTARVADLAERIRARTGITAFKYKSAGNAPAWDLAALTALRARMGHSAKLRFDPNAAYSTEAARQLCAQLEPLGLEFYEDPTDGLEGLARIAAQVKTRLATNMCVIAPEHLAAAYRRGLSVTILGDLFLWGGIMGMREMQAAGALLGHRPSLHSFYESAIITAANAHMALAFGLDAHHPMDCGQPGLAADVVAPGVIQIGGGALHCPAGPGIGITPEPERIAALATAETQIIR